MHYVYHSALPITCVIKTQNNNNNNNKPRPRTTKPYGMRGERVRINERIKPTIAS